MSTSSDRAAAARSLEGLHYLRPGESVERASFVACLLWLLILPSHGQETATARTLLVPANLEGQGTITARTSVTIRSSADRDLVLLERVPSGTLVRKGAVVGQLDRSPLQETVQELLITRTASEAALRSAGLDYEAAKLENRIGQKKLDIKEIDLNHQVNRAKHAVELEKAGRAAKPGAAERLRLAEAQLALLALERKLLHLRAGQLEESVRAQVEVAKSKLRAAEARYARAREALESCVLRASVDGMVIDPVAARRYEPIEPGTTIRPRQAIMLVADPTNLEAVVMVKSTPDVIRVGARARIRAPGADTELSGTVLSSRRTPFGRGIEVRIAIEKPGSLHPGMHVEAVVEGPQREVVVVPLRALTKKTGGWTCSIIRGNEISTRMVRRGQTTGQDVIIEKGVRAGDRVLLSR